MLMMSDAESQDTAVMIDIPNVKVKHESVGESGDSTGSSSPKKRGRGRPPLPKHLLKQNRKSKINTGRPRGRPRLFTINKFGEKVRIETIRSNIGRPQKHRSQLDSNEESSPRISDSMEQTFENSKECLLDIDLSSIREKHETVGESGDSAGGPSPHKRGRGRPPLPKHLLKQKFRLQFGEKIKLKPGRGRPRKHPLPSEFDFSSSQNTQKNSEKSVADVDLSSIRDKHESVGESGDSTGISSPEKRGRGRPPLPKHLLKQKLRFGEKVKRARGRSRKHTGTYNLHVDSNEGGAKTTPYSVEQNSVQDLEKESSLTFKRPRGRPSKSPLTSTEKIRGKVKINRQEDSFYSDSEIDAHMLSDSEQETSQELEESREKVNTKRGRGRPGKRSFHSHVDDYTTYEDYDCEEHVSAKSDECREQMKAKSPVGRPHKNLFDLHSDDHEIQEDSVVEEDSSKKSGEDLQLTPKRKRGRPPKSKLTSTETVREEVKIKRPRGRPRKQSFIIPQDDCDGQRDQNSKGQISEKLGELGEGLEIPHPLSRLWEHSLKSDSDVENVQNDNIFPEGKPDISGKDSSVAVKRPRGRPPKSPLTSTEKRALVKLKKRRGRPSTSRKLKYQTTRWPLPTLTQSLDTVADPDNTILRLTGRHFPDVLTVGTNLCQVCLNNDSETETAFCCSECGGSPPLCAYPCFGIYHTVFRYWQSNTAYRPYQSCGGVGGESLEDWG